MTGERVSMGDEGATGSISATPPPARRRSFLPLLILTLIAFVLGVAVTAWAWPQIERRWGNPAAQSTTPAPLRGAALPAYPARPMNADTAQAMDLRMGQLEERLTRITVEAQAASGNATRAEGLLVAFAARRALDNSMPLGYVEGQLRARFGQAQPRAVATIINAAREPITLADLRGGLADIAGEVVTPPADASWWTALEHEARELISIHRASSPSPRPQAGLDRAIRYLDGGRVNAALTEVERMPGRAAADRWIQLARRYLEARRALDLIETAAILEPRSLRPTEAAIVAQAAPQTP